MVYVPGLTSIGRDEAADSPLLVVSNRGPIEHYFDSEGKVCRRDAGGGLAVALGSVARSQDLTWIAAAKTEADHIVARQGNVRLRNGSRLRLVATQPEAFKLHYSTFSNPILWFLQHGLFDSLNPRSLEVKADCAWQLGYLPVNQAIAEAVAAELHGRPGRVMIQDYHLYLAPLYIRSLCPRATLQHFIHIPWPGPAEWEHLPARIVQTILKGLLTNNSIVFQTPDDGANFLATCAALLPGAEVDEANNAVLYRGSRACVGSNPISVDAGDLRAELWSPEGLAYAEEVRGELGEKTILRVDRLDPSKNIGAGFKAFERLLEDHPEWIGRVRFLAYLVPSREEIDEYRSMTEEVFSLISSINTRFGRNGWQPIEVYHGDNRTRALAAMRFYDVLLVNSLADGMNLVAKEGPIVNEREGSLVLSTRVGAHRELAPAALSIDPESVEDTAHALHEALTMSPLERQLRAMRLRQAVLSNQLGDWLKRQLADLGAGSESRVEASEAAVAATS